MSRYLAEVRQGHTVTVTEHGRPIARIVPVDRPTTLEELRAAGLVKPAARRKSPSREPVRADGTLSDLVPEQRR